MRSWACCNLREENAEAALSMYLTSMDSSGQLIGLVLYWVAPTSKPRSMEALSLAPVAMRMGMSLPSVDSRMAAQTWKPSIFGISTSRKIKSGCSLWNAFNADSPSSASATSSPAASRHSRASSRTVGSSSQIRILEMSLLASEVSGSILVGLSSGLL